MQKIINQELETNTRQAQWKAEFPGGHVYSMTNKPTEHAMCIGIQKRFVIPETALLGNQTPGLRLNTSQL